MAEMEFNSWHQLPLYMDQNKYTKKLKTTLRALLLIYHSKGSGQVRMVIVHVNSIYLSNFCFCFCFSTYCHGNPRTITVHMGLILFILTILINKKLLGIYFKKTLNFLVFFQNIISKFLKFFHLLASTLACSRSGWSLLGPCLSLMGPTSCQDWISLLE